jgi:protein phosphatase 2C-like protein
MQVTYATEAAPGRANEDRVICGDGWAVVLDGATAPDGVESGCIHDVSWLVNHLAAAITRCMLTTGDDLAGDLADTLALAIAETCAAHAATCDLANPDSPSSTVCIARTLGGQLDYLVLGDSPIVIRSGPGYPAVISDDRLSHLPGGRPYSLELVRSLRNKPAGFWVASTDPEAAYRAVTGSVPFAAGTEAGMFTDGVSRLVEIYGYDWEQVLAVMEASGPAGLISVVRSLEMSDPPGLGKKHDDATAVLMTGGRVESAASGRLRRPANWRSLIGI